MGKKLFLLMAFMTMGCAAYSQSDSIRVWNKWCGKSDTMVLYNAANNVIQLLCKGIKAEDVLVKSLDGGLKTGAPEIKGDTISVIAMPYPKAGKRMRLQLTNKQTKKTIKTINFYGEEVPAPAATLGNIPLTNTHPLRKDVLAQTTLKVVFPNSLYSYPYRVKQFNLKARIAGKDILLPGNGPYLTKEIQQILSIAPEGTFIEFTDIKATCPDCGVRTLDNLKMWIK